MTREDVALAYIECALWTSTDDDGDPLDDGQHDLAEETSKTMRAEVDDFLAYCAEQRIEWEERLSAEQCGHDFWLTRNHHGAGFWDRGLGALGDDLTRAAHSFGEANLYTGDDNLIYQA